MATNILLKCVLPALKVKNFDHIDEIRSNQLIYHYPNCNLKNTQRKKNWANKSDPYLLNSYLTKWPL